MDRRSFLKGALTGAAALSGLGSVTPGALGAEEEHEMAAVLKLSSQEWLVPGDNLRDKAQKLREWGATGVELGGGGLAGRVDEVAKALEGTGVQVSAICAVYEGWLISPDAAVRQQAVDSMKEIMTAAGAMASTGLIIVPAFNHHEQLAPKEARQVLLDLLPELGDHAVASKTRVLLEPLNRGEAFFLRMLADAASMCRDAGHPGVALMGDFYHMRIEETSDLRPNAGIRSPNSWKSSAYAPRWPTAIHTNSPEGRGSASASPAL